MKKFIMDRLNERTSLDGAVLIGAGIAFLIFKLSSLVTGIISLFTEEITNSSFLYPKLK